MRMCVLLFTHVIPLLTAFNAASSESPLEPQKPLPIEESPLVRQAKALWEQNKLPNGETIQKWIESPSSIAIQTSPPSEITLSPREIARRAAAAYIRVGWVFQCSKCSNWHTHLAGGYAIARNAVATARHVLNKPERMKENDGYAIAVRNTGEVLVIRGVLAADSTSDVIILWMDSDSLQALPVAADVQIGDSVFCLSEPNGERPYFSSGIVNRFAKNPDAKTNHPLVW